MTKISRFAKTGKFVTKAKAKKSPKTTVTETVKKVPYRVEILNVIKNLEGLIKALKALV